jgi:hypothetical protein
MKQQSGASRRRLSLVLLLGIFAAMLLMVDSEETVIAEADTEASTTAATVATAPTVDDASPSGPFEDFVDLDDSTTAQSAEAVSDDKTVASTETSAGATPKIEQLDEQQQQQQEQAPPQDIVQKGPFIDLLGPTLLSLVLTGENTARFEQNLTNDALSGKTVVGLYFSAGELQKLLLL